MDSGSVHSKRKPALERIKKISLTCHVKGQRRLNGNAQKYITILKNFTWQK